MVSATAKRLGYFLRSGCPVKKHNRFYNQKRVLRNRLLRNRLLRFTCWKATCDAKGSQNNKLIIIKLSFCTPDRHVVWGSRDTSALFFLFTGAHLSRMWGKLGYTTTSDKRAYQRPADSELDYVTPVWEQRHPAWVFIVFGLQYLVFLSFLYIVLLPNIKYNQILAVRRVSSCMLQSCSHGCHS